MHLQNYSTVSQSTNVSPKECEEDWTSKAMALYPEDLLPFSQMTFPHAGMSEGLNHQVLGITATWVCNQHRGGVSNHDAKNDSKGYTVAHFYFSLVLLF